MDEKRTSPACTSSVDFVNEVIHNVDFKSFFQSLITETVSEQMNVQIRKFSTVVRNLQDELTNLNEELDKVKGELHELHTNQEQQMEVNRLNEMNVNDLTTRLNARSLTIEDLQQYTRRNCVVVTGVPEEIGENTDVTILKLGNEKMEVPLTGLDLDRSHRIGKRNGGKPRPIVVKFSRYNVRYRFIKARTNLKGTKVGVQELLTPYTQHLLKRAKDLVTQSRHVKSAWTWDGRVTVQIEQDGQKRRVNVNNENDLHRIYDQTAGFTEDDEYY